MNTNERLAAARAFEKFLDAHYEHRVRAVLGYKDGHTTSFCPPCRLMWTPERGEEAVSFDGGHVRPDPV